MKNTVWTWSNSENCFCNKLRLIIRVQRTPSEIWSISSAFKFAWTIKSKSENSSILIILLFEAIIFEYLRWVITRKHRTIVKPNANKCNSLKNLYNQLLFNLFRNFISHKTNPKSIFSFLFFNYFLKNQVYLIYPMRIQWLSLIFGLVE